MSITKYTHSRVVCLRLEGKLVIRLEAMLRAEYCIYFLARFGRVHAFGYNSVESEPIWM